MKMKTLITICLAIALSNTSLAGNEGAGGGSGIVISIEDMTTLAYALESNESVFSFDLDMMVDPINIIKTKELNGVVIEAVAEDGKVIKFVQNVKSKE